MMECMTGHEKIRAADLSALQIVCYPDPRLRETCSPVETIDASVAALAARMAELMFAHRGVGLAGPQVGVTARLFIASPRFDPDDLRVYVNPEILAAEGQQDDDEGCLSFPDVHCRVKRPRVVTLRAQGLDGAWFEETGEDLTARAFEHETDHLDGRLLVDRMGQVAKLANRRLLKDLEERYAAAS